MNLLCAMCPILCAADPHSPHAPCHTQEELIASMATPDDTCLPFEHWVPVLPTPGSPADGDDGSDGAPERYHVALLGELARRRGREEEVELPAPPGLIEALTDEHAVTAW